MSKPTSSIGRLLAVLAVCAALVLSAVTGATAVALTPKAVKKIATKAATKVLKKKAPSLSVAHATTADSATTAKTADTATTASTADHAKGLVFTLPNQAAATSRTYSFPGLSDGTYLASYTLLASITTGQNLLCQFKPASGPGLAPSWAPGVASAASASGSTIVSVSTGFRLSCAGSTPFSVDATTYVGTVSFVPVTSGPPTAAIP
jgi:hypothetical protein